MYCCPYICLIQTLMGCVTCLRVAADPLYDFLKKKQSGLLVSDIKWVGALQVACQYHTFCYTHNTRAMSEGVLLTPFRSLWTAELHQVPGKAPATSLATEVQNSAVKSSIHPSMGVCMFPLAVGTSSQTLGNAKLGGRMCQVDREGNVVKRYGSSTTPLQIEADIQKYL